MTFKFVGGPLDGFEKDVENKFPRWSVVKYHCQ